VPAIRDLCGWRYRITRSNGKPLPGVAQVAIQQGRYAGRLIHSRVIGDRTPGPFSYFDKGNMAVVGKGFAVLQSGKFRVAASWLGSRGRP